MQKLRLRAINFLYQMSNSKYNTQKSSKIETKMINTLINKVFSVLPKIIYNPNTSSITQLFRRMLLPQVNLPNLRL
jgi:hypothetical protein